MLSSAVRRSIGAVIFDMDGLMFDTERIAVDSWIAAAKEAGYSIGISQILRTVGMTREGTRDVLLEQYGEDFPFTTIRDRRLQLAAETIRAHGVPMKAGLRELLDFLRDRRVPMAVASSSERRRVLALLSACDLVGFFSALVSGEDAARGKPDPEIFLKAATAIGRAPEHCLVLEDSVNGIAAAYAAGMIPIAVPDLVPLDEATRAKASEVFENLSQVKAYLAVADFSPRS
jgi:HAD superfamily hydrolase (TIGR01509 family)